MNLPSANDYRYVLVTTMKDECPYILDWLAYHFSIGFTHAVIMTNDCSDGTDKLCRNLESTGLVTHMNNKGPHPRGVQKTAWKRAERLKPIQEADWMMALDVDEYLQLNIGRGNLEDMFAQFQSQPVAISFVWQTFGNNDVERIEDHPVFTQFTRSSHPLQAKPYQIRGLKTLFRKRFFEDIGTHRPHGAKIGAIAGRHWLNGDACPIDELFMNPYWCVWDNGYLFGGALGRVFHYAIRSKDAFMLKMIRGFVNRTEKGVRSEKSPLNYWQMFDWNIVENKDLLTHKNTTQILKNQLTSDDKIARLHSRGVAMHQEWAQKTLTQYPEFEEEFQEILHLAPRTELSVNDPVLKKGSTIPLTFRAKAMEERSQETLIRQPFINIYYSKLSGG